MKTILIIEDNADVRENTAEILELANYKVLTAENGKKGVELAQKSKPDLIICDEAHRTTGGDLGNYLMAGIPIEAEEIEDLMARG